jgi:hypothetical protein
MASLLSAFWLEFSSWICVPVGADSRDRATANDCSSAAYPVPANPSTPDVETPDPHALRAAVESRLDDRRLVWHRTPRDPTGGAAGPGLGPPARGLHGGRAGATPKGSPIRPHSVTTNGRFTGFTQTVAKPSPLGHQVVPKRSS